MFWQFIKEIRTVLRKDASSGYNALEEEIPESEEDPFNDLGGSSNEQDPFSEDEGIEFRTTKNGVKFPLKEGESTKESCREFFKEKHNNKKAKITSKEEKQKKINSVKIDPQKDNILPELNKEEQEKLGVGNKKVRLKKSIFERNQKHNDVNKGDDNFIIGSGLYNPDMVLPAKSPNYHHFISHIGDNKNSIVLIDVVSNGEYLDIVHYYYTKDKGVRRIQKNH